MMKRHSYISTLFAVLCCHLCVGAEERPGVYTLAEQGVSQSQYQCALTNLLACSSTNLFTLSTEAVNKVRNAVKPIRIEEFFPFFIGEVRLSSGATNVVLIELEAPEHPSAPLLRFTAYDKATRWAARSEFRLGWCNYPGRCEIRSSSTNQVEDILVIHTTGFQPGSQQYEVVVQMTPYPGFQNIGIATAVEAKPKQGPQTEEMGRANQPVDASSNRR